MGTEADPDEPDYPKGDESEACEIAIFDGHTPEFVLAVFEGIEGCPPVEDGLGDGEYLLEQDDAKPSHWSTAFFDNGGFWTIDYWASGGSLENGSELSMLLTAAPIFEDWSAAKCVTSFSNTNQCILGHSTHSGTGTIRWGPDIKPEE